MITRAWVASLVATMRLLDGADAAGGPSASATADDGTNNGGADERNSSAPDRYIPAGAAAVDSAASINTPQTLEEAMASPHCVLWLEAISSELLLTCLNKGCLQQPVSLRVSPAAARQPPWFVFGGRPQLDNRLAAPFFLPLSLLLSSHVLLAHRGCLAAFRVGLFCGFRVVAHGRLVARELVHVSPARASSLLHASVTIWCACCGAAWGCLISKGNKQPQLLLTLTCFLLLASLEPLMTSCICIHTSFHFSEKGCQLCTAGKWVEPPYAWELIGV